ncbi:hypothetical protein ACK31U_03370 [Aeromonas caviae]
MKPIFKIEYDVHQASHSSPINNEYVTLSINSWFESSSKTDNDRTYRLIFPKGSSKQLMLHRSGELEGLKTTSILSNGKIEAVAGLDEVFEINEYKILSFALFGVIDCYLKNIDFTLQKIHQTQRFETQAKFERITYILEDTFSILPELLVDESLKTPYLNQIVDSNSNCYELYSFFKQELKARCSELSQETRNDKSIYSTQNRLNKLRKLNNDNAYAALERFSFGKICEMLLSRNFTSAYIENNKRHVLSMIDEMIEIIKGATYDEELFRKQWQRDIDSTQLTHRDREREQQIFLGYISEYEKIIKDIKDKLHASVKGLFVISDYIHDKDICILIKDGEMFIEEFQ